MNSTKLLFLVLFGALQITLFGQQTDNNRQPKGLGVGDQVEDFTAYDADGNRFNLTEALAQGPVLVIFYRGQWCPYCNKHLSRIQDSLDLLVNKGVRVVAISPEKPENLEKMRSKSGATFSLLYDLDYRVAEMFDVLFLPAKTDRMKYNMIGADLKNAHSDNSEKLPVPATFLIGVDSKIAWRHFELDYKERSSVADILKAVAL